jgi:hypothetical protein
VDLQCGIASYEQSLHSLSHPAPSHSPGSVALVVYPRPQLPIRSTKPLPPNDFGVCHEGHTHLLPIKAAAASPAHDRAHANTSEGRPAEGKEREDREEPKHEPARRKEQAKSQQRHRPTKPTPQESVERAAVE